MQKFVNRKAQLDSLEKQYNSPSSSLVIVYGRRRVGKTALITEFLKSHKDSIYFLATEESEAQNLNYFKGQVADFTHNELLRAATVDWQTVFKTFVEFKTETKKIVVIDEFQYIGQSNRAFPSVLQKIWDTMLGKSNIMLILCGSLVSLMKSQTLDYGSPLYGRRTAQIKLGQIAFKHYHEFYDGKTNGELLPFYAVTGGVPKYIEAFKGYDDIFEAIKENVFNPQSFLYEEPYFLLQKEVSEIGSYFSLIKAIAMGNRKLSDIAATLGVKQTSLSKYLKVLIDLDLIEREVPVTDTPEKSKNGLYRITDNYIAFWFRFVYPYMAYLEKGETEYVLSQLKKEFVQNFVSFVYEDVCREKMWELSASGTINVRFDKVGRFWNAKVGEIDIVALDSVNKRLVVGECKYSSSPKGLSVLHDLKAKAEKLNKLIGADKVQYVIFCPSGFTPGLLNEANINGSIYLM